MPTSTKPIHKIKRPKKKERPLMEDFMQRLAAKIERQKVTRKQLAEAMGTTPQEITEWISCTRNAPGCEMTLKLREWMKGR